VRGAKPRAPKNPLEAVSKRPLVACATKKHFERVVIFLILRSKIKKMTTRSLFYFAAGGGEYLLRQAQGDF
jgi:hypothetical protein